MLGFLQGLAYGLLISCPLWLTIGLIEPRWAVPTEPPRRWQVLLRYWLLVPFVAATLWLTSLFGGLGPSLGGWLAGLAAIPLSLPVERALRRGQRRLAQRRRQAAQAAAASRRRTAREQEAREAGCAELDPAHPPPDADDLVEALCQAKGALLGLERPDLAVQADRVYNRYTHVCGVLDRKFAPGEITDERARALVREVCWTAVDQLKTMVSLAQGVRGVDADHIRRRLAQERDTLTAEERQALEQRLRLVEGTEARLRELSGRNEAAITALDDTAVSVSAVRTDRPHASVDADRALAELHRFAARAEQYEHQ